MLWPAGAPSDGSRGAGHNPPAGVGTTSLVHCQRGPALGAGAGVAAEGLFASRGSECHCRSAGRHGFVSAFLYSHFLKRLAHDHLHRRQDTRKMEGVQKKSKFWQTCLRKRRKYRFYLLSEALGDPAPARPLGRPRVPTWPGASSPAPESAPATAALPAVTGPKLCSAADKAAVVLCLSHYSRKKNLTSQSYIIQE